MIAFDEKNHPISSMQDVQWTGPDGGHKSFQDRWKDAPADEKPYNFSPASIQLLSIHTGSAQPAAQEPLRSVLLNPERIDPMTLVVSDALLQTADREGKNLAACPDDFLLDIVEQAKYYLSPGRTLTKHVLWSLFPLANSQVSDEGSWITLAPIDALAATETRADRTALGKFVRTHEEKGYVSIEDCAQAAASMRTRVEPDLFQSFPYLLANGNDIPGGAGLDLLRFYASLGTAALDPSGHAKQLRVADLDNEQLARLNDYIYEYKMDGVSQSVDSYTEADLEALSEPTEVWPDGLPADGTITLEPRDSKTYQITYLRDGSSFSSLMTFDQIVRDIAGGKAGFDPTKFEAKSMQSVNHRDLMIQIQFGSSRRQGILQETVPTGKEYVIGQLPADLQQKLDQQVNEMVRGMEFSKKSEPKPAPAPPTR